MSMSNHTPGPWEIDYFNQVHQGTIVAGKDQVVAKVKITQGYEDERANCHLIAAAPNMYQALEMILKDDKVMNSLSGVQAMAVLDSIAKARGPRVKA